MAASSGSFGEGANAPKQCTATSRRTGERCKGPAVAGSRTQKCRMHGGKVLPGLANPNFRSGRYSRHLPTRLQEVYEEAISNPDILEMTDHIALLESRAKEIMTELAEEEVVPRWSILKNSIDEFTTAIIGADKQEDRIAAVERLNKFLESGVRFDTAFAQLEGTLEQLRKMADTEIKRKKDLHHMIPVERVQTLMASVALAIKRQVGDPDTLRKIYAEMELLRNGTHATGDTTMSRTPMTGPQPQLPTRYIDAEEV